MGFCEILTLIFIVLKLCAVIDWSWWLVLSPELVALAGYMLFMGMWLVAMGSISRRTRRGWHR